MKPQPWADGTGRHVVMLGPAPEGRGGMASVAAAYREGGVFERWRVRFIDTVAPGGSGAVAKLACALRAALQLAALLLRGKVLLAHLHIASGASFWRKSLYCWMLYLAGRPVVLHVHGGHFRQFHDGLQGWRGRYMRATLARAARVIVLSPLWVERLAVMAPRERLVALANPVVPWAQAPRPQPQQPAAGPASELEPLVFLFLGRLERAKGIDELLPAFASYLAQGGRGRLRLAGDGDAAAVRRRCEVLGIAAQVELLGWVEGATKRAALAAADVFVLPSHVEGLPVAMLEAMHCGLAVLASAVGSIPETVADGREALLVPPGDGPALAAALLRLYREPALCEALAQAGQRLFAERYSMESIAPQLDAIYAQALAGAAVPACREGGT